MSTEGRPEGVHLCPGHEGRPVSPQGRPKGEYLRSGREGRPVSARCGGRAAVTILALAVLAGCAGVGGVAPPTERVSFDSLDAGAAGAPLRITGLLYRPDGPAPAGGFPAVIALHGCGGMFSDAPGRESVLSLRNAMWKDLLLADGYAVLFPDSFNPRGLRAVCTIRLSERTIVPATRRLDALGALAWLGAQPGIDRTRIALMGFSHGGSTTLATINARDPAVAAFRAATGAPPFFRAAVAFYPGCRISLNAGERWQPAVGTRIYIGELDDWTPAARCAALGEAQKARGAPLDVTLYPDSYHGFDGPPRRLTVLTDVPSGVNPGRGVTLASNQAAGADAKARTRAFLRAQFAVASAQSEDGIIPRAGIGAVTAIAARP